MRIDLDSQFLPGSRIVRERNPGGPYLARV